MEFRYQGKKGEFKDMPHSDVPICEKSTRFEKVNLDYLVCPEGHFVPRTRENFAKDFSGGHADAKTLRPMYESGLYCHECDRPYGLSKLKESSKDGTGNTVSDEDPQ